MTHLPITDFVVDLRLRDDCGSLRVTLGSFVQFANQMDQDLESLVAAWEQYATPAARLNEALFERHGLAEQYDETDADE